MLRWWLVPFFSFTAREKHQTRDKMTPSCMSYGMAWHGVDCFAYGVFGTMEFHAFRLGH